MLCSPETMAVVGRSAFSTGAYMRRIDGAARLAAGSRRKQQTRHCAYRPLTDAPGQMYMR